MQIVLTRRNELISLITRLKIIVREEIKFYKEIIYYYKKISETENKINLISLK